MTQFKGFRTASSNILKAFGGDVTYQKIQNGIYNKDTGTMSELITETTIKGFLEDLKKEEVNELIQQTDKKLSITRGDITFEPTPQDRIKIAGIVYTILSVNKSMVNGEDVNYELFLRA